ncbi:MAG: hypothetical protein LBS34_02545, partial [Rickettsiales bacterium]|nr:hypothetical protein [Rickettsiales bacterium]
DEEKDELWNFLLGYNRSKSEFNVRFLAVMLKKFYMIKSYIKAVLDVLSKIRCDGYYAKMGIAWTVAEAYIKFPDITTRYLDNYNFDKFTHKMVLQKIRESLRQPKQC